MLKEYVRDSRAWNRETLAASSWQFELPSVAAAEIAEIVTRMRHAPLPLLLRRPGDFVWPACRHLMLRVKEALLRGPGFAVIRGLDLRAFGREESTTVFWMLGQWLSQPVATKWDGTLLYDVTDTGRRFGPGVRGSTTNVELSFHTDNAFGRALPDYVGLLCLQPARQGGISRICSLYTLHNAMLAEQPELLARLYEPAFYDRQGEHAPDAPPYLPLPLFAFADGVLSARLTPNLIRRGHAMAGKPMDGPLTEALEYLEGLLRREEFIHEFQLEEGALQYVNNRWTAHFRSAFHDAEDALQKRHLIRVWYRETGGQPYDG